jgi:nucleotide-binding universal stress UspA family protein
VVVAWEPGLGFGAAPLPEIWLAEGDISQALGTDQRIHEAARRLAEKGTALAESGGMPAAAVAIADDAKVADTLVRIANERGAAAIVVGAHIRHGLSRIASGSTAKHLMEQAPCPVVVVPSIVE